MRRNLPQPLDAGVAQGGRRVQAASDGVGDEGAAFLGQQGQQFFFSRNQRVQFGGFAVEVGGDGALFGKGWDKKIFLVSVITT